MIIIRGRYNLDSNNFFLHIDIRFIMSCSDHNNLHKYETKRDFWHWSIPRHFVKKGN